MRITFVDAFWEGVTYEHEPPEPYNKTLPPASCKWSSDMNGETSDLLFTCPCGCGKIGAVCIARPGIRGWQWNGDRVNPTFTPSILQTNGCRWHGYLTNGEFKSV